MKNWVRLRVTHRYSPPIFKRLPGGQTAHRDPYSSTEGSVVVLMQSETNTPKDHISEIKNKMGQLNLEEEAGVSTVLVFFVNGKKVSTHLKLILHICL